MDAGREPVPPAKVLVGQTNASFCWFWSCLVENPAPNKQRLQNTKTAWPAHEAASFHQEEEEEREKKR